jgi:hypothetical protein
MLSLQAGKLLWIDGLGNSSRSAYICLIDEYLVIRLLHLATSSYDGAGQNDLAPAVPEKHSD